VRIGDEAVVPRTTPNSEVAPTRPRSPTPLRPSAERLASKQLDERIEAWVRELRAGAEIRYNP
jgi:hypothetical protein